MKRTLSLALLLAACQPTPAVVAPAAPLMASKLIPVGKTPHGMTAAAGFIYNSNVGDNTISVIDTKTDTVATTLSVNGTPGYQHAFRTKYVACTDTKNGKLLIFDPAQQHKLLQTIDLGKGPDKLRHTEDENSLLASLTGENKLVQLTFGDDLTKAPTRKDYAVGSNPGEHRALEVEAGWAIQPNAGDNTTSVVNLADGSIKSWQDGNAPGPVALGTTGETAVAALVGNTASNTITIFTIPSGEKTTLTGVGLAPTDMVVDPVLHRVFVTMAGSNEVAVVDYLTKTLVGKVPTGDRPVHIFDPLSLEASAKLLHADEDFSHEIWVGNDSGDSVTVFDGATLRVKATVAVGKGHHKLAFWGSKAYVSSITSNDVAVIDRTAIK